MGNRAVSPSSSSEEADYPEPEEADYPEPDLNVRGAITGFSCDICSQPILTNRSKIHCSTCSTTPNSKGDMSSFDICGFCWKKDTEHKQHKTRIEKHTPAMLVDRPQISRMATSVWRCISTADGLFHSFSLKKDSSVVLFSFFFLFRTMYEGS